MQPTPSTVTSRAQRSLIVMHGGQLVPSTGGGQRSLLILQALCALGPTTVVSVKENRIEHDCLELPAGAEVDIVYLGKDLQPVKQVEPKALRRVVIKRDRLMSKIFPIWAYRRRTQFAKSLDQIIAEKKPDIILFRYINGMMITGFKPNTDATIVVDVDDRPDMLALTRYENQYGKTLADWVFSPYVKLTLMSKVMRKLRSAQLVLYSKAADILEGSDAHAEVIPNVPFFSPSAVSSEMQSNLLFVGTQTYYPNSNGIAWFLEECWPKISMQDPRARLRIVGAGDWKSFGQNYQSLDRVDFVGQVDDLSAEYAHANATICPIFEGAGTQIKVIESCAFGRPVVSSVLSSTGFGPKIGQQLAVARNSDEFVEHCLKFLKDPQGALKLGHILRNLQQEQFSRASFVQKLRLAIITKATKPALATSVEVQS